MSPARKVQAKVVLRKLNQRDNILAGWPAPARSAVLSHTVLCTATAGYTRRITKEN